MDLNRPMKEVLSELTKYPIKTRLSLSGTLVVARDIAHAQLKERLDSGQGMPDYMKNHPVYYAGPAKTPDVCVVTVVASLLYGICTFFDFAASGNKLDIVRLFGLLTFG